MFGAPKRQDVIEPESYAPPLLKLVGRAVLPVPAYLRALDYLYVTRPILFFPGWTTLLIGVLCAMGVFGADSGAGSRWSLIWWDTQIVLSMLIFAAAMGGCFILNQLQDVETDRKNGKLFFFGEGFISRKQGYLQAAILIGVSILGAALLNGAVLAAVIVFNLITGIMYNYAPYNFKSYPIRGLIANSLMGWLAFVIGWLVIRGPGAEMVIASVPYLFFNTGLYILTTMPDASGDAASGKQTISTRYGLRTSLFAAAFLYLLGGLSAIALGDWFAMVILHLALIFLVRAVFTHKMPHVVVALKMGVFFLSLGICIKFPLFLGLIAGAYFLTRFYYKERFHLEYPSFRGD